MKKSPLQSRLFAMVGLILALAAITPILEILSFVVIFLFCKMIGVKAAFSYALAAAAAAWILISALELFDLIFDSRKKRERKLRLQRVRENRCIDCGHSRAGVESVRCPECGCDWTEEASS